MRELGRAFTLIVASTSLAWAMPAVTHTDLTGYTNTLYTSGWEFITNNTPNRVIAVTALSIFDSSQDGLIGPHEVGIFDAAGNLVLSAVVPGGTSAPLVNQYRTVAVTPFVLATGQTYRIAAHYEALDLVHINAADFVVNPAITYVGSRRGQGGPPL